MEDLLYQLTTTATGLLLLGGAYFVWLLTGIANKLFDGKKWSWKRFWEDIAKTALMCVAVLAWVALCDGIEWFANKCNCDITALMDGASVAGLLGGIIGGTIFYAVKAYRNIINFVNANHIEAQVGEVNYKEIAERVYEFFNTSEEAVEAQKKFEQEHEVEGGLGTYYSVPYDTYEHFRTATMGNGYDVDGKYGFQCYDGAALLWQQLGMFLSTGGTGAARGCWEPAREQNKGTQFDLIYNKKDIKRGDVIVINAGTYGHIFYADEDYKGGKYIAGYGQNQSADMKFCVKNISLDTFLGAFRYKGWEGTPTPTPKPDGKFKVGDKVVPTRLVDYYGTPLKQWDSYYTVSELNGDRAVLTAPRNGKPVVWAAMRTDDIRKLK